MKKTTLKVTNAYTEKVGPHGPFRSVVVLSDRSSHESIHSTRTQASRNNARMIALFAKKNA